VSGISDGLDGHIAGLPVFAEATTFTTFMANQATFLA